MNPLAVRGKFKVVKVAQVDWSKDVREITLLSIYDPNIPEDQAYSKATPSATIVMTVDNPPASDYLALGKFFYVDFTEVPNVQ